jgi:hypothetical protein
MATLPEISNFSLAVPERETQVDAVSGSALKQELIAPYKKAIKDQLWRAIGSLEVLNFKRRSLAEIAVKSGRNWLKTDQLIEGLTYVMPRPLRIAKTMIEGRITKFDLALSTLQLNCQLAAEKMNAAAEPVVLVVRNRLNSGPICITQSYFFLFQRLGGQLEIGAMPSTMRGLADISHVVHQVNNVQITSLKTEQSILIRCENYFQAESLCTYFRSRIRALRLK